MNAPESAALAPLTFEDFANDWLSTARDPTFRNQLDARLVRVLAGEYEQAREPLELASDQQQQAAARIVDTLIAIREGHGGEPGDEATRALSQVKRLEESLIPLSDLKISDLKLTRAVRGYGRYEALDPAEFITGREAEFVVYCQLENFVSRHRDDDAYESQFSMRTTILNRAGDVVLEINDDSIADQCRARRRDCYIPRLVHLPATLSPGQYVVKVTIVDKIAGKVAESRVTFRVVARS